MAKWKYVAGGLFLAVAAVAASGKKKKKKPTVEEDQQAIQRGDSAGSQRRGSYGHVGGAQEAWEKAYAAQEPQRQMLISLWPGVGFLISFCRRLYNVPLVFSVGYPSARGRQYAKGNLGGRKFFETKEDSGMLQSGLALRIDTGLFQKKTDKPIMAGILPSIYVDEAGRWFVWDESGNVYVPVPISGAKGGVVDVRNGNTRESVATQWTAGLAYGDADNVLWAMSTWDGKALKTLPQGPQGNQSRIQIAAMFPPISMLGPKELTAALGGGDAPAPSLLEDPAGWLYDKAEEAAVDALKEAIPGTIDYFKEEGTDILSGDSQKTPSKIGRAGSLNY